MENWAAKMTIQQNGRSPYESMNWNAMQILSADTLQEVALHERA